MSKGNNENRASEQASKAEEYVVAPGCSFAVCTGVTLTEGEGIEPVMSCTRNNEDEERAAKETRIAKVAFADHVKAGKIVTKSEYDRAMKTMAKAKK